MNTRVTLKALENKGFREMQCRSQKRPKKVCTWDPLLFIAAWRRWAQTSEKCPKTLHLKWTDQKKEKDGDYLTTRRQQQSWRMGFHTTICYALSMVLNHCENKLKRDKIESGHKPGTRFCPGKPLLPPDSIPTTYTCICIYIYTYIQGINLKIDPLFLQLSVMST